MLQSNKKLWEAPDMPIRALLMDIDDTLFDFQTGYKRALRAPERAFHRVPRLRPAVHAGNVGALPRARRGTLAAL